MQNKDVLRRKFSSKPDTYYKVELFDREGYKRHKCGSCGKFFWSIRERKFCPDQPCSVYDFLGDSPTSKSFSYVESWKQVEDFFVKRDHTSVRRYPVVCRWRPDLFFTVASIIDFQRIEGGQTIFELPHNPLIVPQICLRFNDLQNVGVSGKHFSSFCMIGQHSVSDKEGYWKDRCIDLDFDLLKGPFGIRPEEIIFLEDVWVGYGAFGYSLEYFVRGLELGNAVFTAFKGTPDSYREMEEKVIDMGAGLERFAWLSQGTPTSYEASFGPVLESILRKAGITSESDLMSKYTTLVSPLDWEKVTDVNEVRKSVAQKMNLPYKELEAKILPMNVAYSLADHVRTLVFALADGGLPSNVGGGYNLRVVLRRALELLEIYKWNIGLEEIAQWHVDYLKSIFPELDDRREEIATLIKVEEERYAESVRRTVNVLRNLTASNQVLSEERVIELYDSDGVTPEQLVRNGVDAKVPADFYSRVTARHSSPKYEAEKSEFDLEGTLPTAILFYDDPPLYRFRAKVLRVLKGKFLVLDRTAFFARAGGQEPDYGSIDTSKVLDVIREGSHVVHRVDKASFSQGDTVDCKVDEQRRSSIMRHHTATHILNASARKTLGSWVWQHSAFKDVDKARLDITHYSSLTSEDIARIEGLANQVVRANIPVRINVLPRMEAESKYGFRLYQGGVAPTKNLRIVSIGEFDVEACGGTHARATGELGLIKILKTERIQDGVIRLEFTAGGKAVDHSQKQDALLSQVSQLLESPQDKVVESTLNLKEGFEKMRKRQRIFLKRFSATFADVIIREATEIEGLKVYITADEGLDEEYHIAVGESAVRTNPALVYCGLITESGRVRILLFSGREAQEKGVDAAKVIRDVAALVGGSGGGDHRFAQGGGTKPEKVNDAKKGILVAVKKMLAT